MVSVTIELIEKCKKNNRVAQKQLYYLTKDMLKSIALRYCSNIDDAKDFVQEAYLKIFRNINQYDQTKGKFTTWSTSILVNTICSAYRKNKLQIVDSDKILDSQVAEDASKNYIDKLTIQEVYQCLNLLNRDHRIVLNMHYFEEYTYKEMAKILGLKESSVRSRVTRAKKELCLLWNKTNKTTYEVKSK